MRLIIPALVVLLVSGSIAKAEEMTTLQEFIRSNPSSGNDKSALYILYRCTSLFGVLMSLSPKGGVAELLEAKMQQFMTTTIKLQSELAGMSLEEAEKRVWKTIGPMGKKYVEAANENYINKGNYVGGALIEGDLGTCGEIIK